jgi:pyruvate/2-oxoglutarate dehydrogenase complex dihydrolipoamide acyltransferase (E2) component
MGDVLYEVETEKVSNEVEAPGDGVMVEVLVSEDEVAAVGQDVCIVESA